MINSDLGLPMQIHRLSLPLLLAVSLAVGLACEGRRAPVAEKGGTASPSTVAEPRPAVETADVARTPRPMGARPPVIWLGLDGLDRELLDRLAAEGKVPNWKRLVEEGTSGKLASFMPVLSPILWTTAATGVGPDVHRVLDFQEVDPKTGRKIPVSGRSRAVPAVWNLASAAGRKVGVVGWWATHPAEEVGGFFVSDHASPLLFEKLPLAGVAFPSALEPGVAQVVARDGAVTDGEIASFLDVPGEEIARARASRAGMENPIVALARILAATRVYHRIARDLYDRERPDLMALYLQGTDEIGHVFASFVPPRLSCVSEEDFGRYSRAVDAFYTVVDRMLGQWMRRAREDGAALVVHSDHGFKWGADRSCERSSLNWSTAAFWHRLDGVYAAWGAGVAGGRGAAATLFDIAPTVCALLGIPADRRMRGRPLASAFPALTAPARSDSFASVAVRRVEAREMTPEQANEYAKKLLALGYLSGGETRPLAASGGDRPGMTEGAWNNLGLYYRESSKQFDLAEKAFAESLALRPDYHSPMFNLAILHRERGDRPKAHEWLFRSLAAGHADPEGTLAQWALRYRDRNEMGAAKDLLEKATAQYPVNELFARELALARFRLKDCPGADAALVRFEQTTADPATLNALGLFRTCLGRRREAVALFERSLRVNPDQPGVIQSLRLVRGAGAGAGASGS